MKQHCNCCHMKISLQPINWMDEANCYANKVNYVSIKRPPQKGDMVACPGGIGIYTNFSICPYHLSTGNKPNFPTIAHVLLLLPYNKRYENKLASHLLEYCQPIIGTTDVNFNREFGLSDLIIDQSIAKIEDETFILETETEVELQGIYISFNMKPYRNWIHQKKMKNKSK